MKTYSSNKFDRSNRRSCFSNYRNDSKNVWRRFNYGLYQNSICNLWYYDYPWLHTYVRITGNQRSKLSRNDIRRKSVWKGSFYSKIKGVKTFFFRINQVYWFNLWIFVQKRSQQNTMCPHQKKKEYFQSTKIIMIWTKIHFIKIYPKQISNLFSSSSWFFTRTVLRCSYCLFIYWLWSHSRAIFTIFLAVYTIAFFPVFISFNLVLARALASKCTLCVVQKCHL